MREDLIEYIIDNRDYFKEKYKHLFEQQELAKSKEDKAFHEDIDNGLSNMLISGMSGELSRATGADMETIMIVLEEVNLEALFK